MPHKTKEAKSEYMKKRYQEKKEELKQYQREYKEQNKTKADFSSIRSSLKKKLKAVEILGGKCMECNFDHPAALHFHHRDPSQKEFQISKACQHYSWERVLQEIQKCDLLCANCHAIKHCKYSKNTMISISKNEHDRKITVSADIIRQWYWDDKKSIKDIAELLRVDRSSVHYFMKMNDIPRRSTGDGKRLQTKVTLKQDKLDT